MAFLRSVHPAALTVEQWLRLRVGAERSSTSGRRRKTRGHGADAQPVRRSHETVWGGERMVTLQLVATSLVSLGFSGLFGASLYDTVVLAPNLKGGPAALEHGRLFMANATPANLFRVLSPTTQVLLLLAVVANWSGPERRWLLIGALVALVLCDVITFTYHYPRLRIMFGAPLNVAAERVTLAAKQWIAANYIRLGLLLGGWCASLYALMRLVQTMHPGSRA